MNQQNKLIKCELKGKKAGGRELSGGEYLEFYCGICYY